MAGIFLPLLLLAGCLPASLSGPGAETQAPGLTAPDLPADWPDRVFAELTEKYPAKETRLFFVSPPRPARLRYHYWTEKRYEGLAGLVVVRSLSEGGLFGGESGPWQVVYLFDPEGQLAFLSGRLEWIDVEPPLYAMETIDQTQRSTIRHSRAIDLDEAREEALKQFMVSPFDKLTDPYALP
ncbi:MAG: hypothetical protein LBF58_03340 [Deltaproteobacteria bacterium]|jgi:hypothetical protein|nr:hypothetical protein [Deltaproteobacteria bacterium]